MSHQLNKRIKINIRLIYVTSSNLKLYILELLILTFWLT